MKKTYPSKVLLALGEAISGNKGLLDWLLKSPYKELGLFVYALNNKADARKWLMENGHPHLMATINGAEGNRQALAWLEQYEFDVLAKVARVADNDDEAMHWLMQRGYREMAGIAQKMRFVKNEIESSNNDVHKISKE